MKWGLSPKPCPLLPTVRQLIEAKHRTLSAFHNKAGRWSSYRSGSFATPRSMPFASLGEAIEYT
jgi:hypothetical protein